MHIEIISVTKDMLHQAFFKWELRQRAGECRPAEEVAKLPVEQVASEAANAMWDFLTK